jgi:hypothetical protein
MESTGRLTPQLRRLAHYSYDRCSLCDGHLPRGLASYAGYGPKGEPIYVGDCCKANLSELASHIYWWWENYRRPAASAVLWRYMDFAKFTLMLRDQAIYFARADKLGDPYEGARGIGEREGEWRNYSLDYLRNAIKTVPRGEQPLPPSEEIDREAERLYREIEEVGRRELSNNYVTCWHENSGESEALWRLYCPPSSAGLAIRTKFARLRDALPEGETIKFGCVNYIDFKERFAGTYDRVFYKRKSLSHEAEVRGVLKRDRSEPISDGVSVPIDLDRVAEAIVVSPFAPAWFADVLNEVMRRFQVSLRVTQSELLDKPFF